MNIQNAMIHDPSQPLAQVPQVMAVPEVSAPRSNPLSMIWRRRNVVLIVTAVCLAAAYVKYFISPAVYRSEAKLFVSNLKSPGDTSPNSAQANLNNQVSLLKSATVLVDALSTPEVANSRTFQVDSRLNLFKQNLNASVGKENDIITLSFDSPNQTEARVILEKVIDAYQNHYTKEKTVHVDQLNRWRKQKQEELDKKQAQLLAIKKANGALSFTGDKGNIVHQKLASLQEAVTQAHIDTLNAKSDVDSARKLASTPEGIKKLVEFLRSTTSVVSSDASEQSLRSQLTAMEQQYEVLASRYLRDHPSVRAAEATIASLKARIGEMDRSIAETHLLALDQKLVAAKNRQAELQSSYDEQKKSAMALNDAAVEADALDQDVKRLASVIDKADLQLIELNASDAGLPKISVFDPPNTPSSPISPNRNMMLFQGLLIGLFFGCFVAIVRDWTDQGLRSTDEIMQALNVSVLGSVPHMAGPPNPMSQGRKVDLEPASDVAETYRTIRTAVFFGTPERESRTILVTSPAPGDGKSTFASNLAIAMAQTGKRVLLVDCDFRRPVQHRIFECRPAIGLSSVLTGGESLEKAVQATGIAGLDILPAGPIPTNPSEMLNSQSFNEILEELSVRYEHVVIDSPPVMAVADSRILAAMCSVTILVLRAGSSTRKSAQHTRKALEAVGAHILGVVVNDVSPAQDRHGDFGGYSSYRSRYNGHRNGSSEATAPSRGSTTAMVPARSFLDLRRK